MVTKLAPKRLFVMEIENVNCGCNNTVIKKDIELTKSVAYIYSSNYVKVCDQGYKVTSRASVTHSLIEAYGLLKYASIIEPKVADEKDLTEFHSEDYIKYLQSVNCIDDVEKVEEECIQYGLCYDCPLMRNQFDYVANIAGGTLSAAQCLIDGTHQIAINWAGGWHHGKKDGAAGFCYVNDIVLGILKLKQKYDKVLYVDLDLHHGDGVEDAFCYTSKVMTVSLHKYEQGFYPGTGNSTDVGAGKGRYYAVNVPLKNGIKDEQFFKIFKSVLTLVKDRFVPNVVVCQCGADGISGDPMASFNLTPIGIGQCISEILSWVIPVMFLGGGKRLAGGYHIANTARCWTYLTSVIVGKHISSSIPENPHFLCYGPGFDLEITPSNRNDYNTPNYITNILSIVRQNLENIK